MLSSRALPSPGVGRRRYQHSIDRYFIRARRRAAPSAVTCSIAAAAAAPSPSPRPPPLLHQTKTKACRAAAAAASSPSPSPPQPAPPPLLLLQTKNKACLTAAIEAGRLTAAVFTNETRELARQWRKLARFDALLLLSEAEGGAGSMVQLNDDENDAPTTVVVGRWAKVPDAGALRQAEASLSSVDPALRYVVMDSLSTSSSSWRIIPAENLVAFAQQQPWWRRSKTRLLATAATSADVGALLGSLEAGTDGVVLVTDDPSEVRAACLELERRARASSPPLLLSTVAASPSPSPDDRNTPQHPVYEEAVVTRVDPVGMADRACVDLASALQPGQGLLVGCFARALFLVHSERDETSYIAARPFRVNAGPLAQYVLAEGPGFDGTNAGRTAYLSELRCGRTVAVAGADGRLAEAEAVVARVKVERRPVVLIEAETPNDGQRHSVLLQNAETVKLVGPSLASSGGRSDDENDASTPFWRAVSVAQLAPGDRVYVLRQPAARHTGLAIDEGVSER